MNKKEVRLNSTNIYKGRIISLFVDEVECFNSKKATREVVKHPGGVCILAFDEDGLVLLEKQYRYPFDSVIYELPAGKLEANEDPLIAAKRELEEETGYIATDLEYYGKIYPSVGYTDEIIYLYVAKQLEKGTINLDEDENLDVIHISLDELKKMIDEDKINDSKTICLVGKYLMNRKS